MAGYLGKSFYYNAHTAVEPPDELLGGNPNWTMDVYSSERS
jgi:hypothetical protein